MSGNAGGVPHFNINNSGVLYVAGNDITGEHAPTINHGRLADDQLISLFRKLLDSVDIPWSDSRLTEARHAFEGGVEQGDPQAPGIKQAILRLKEICGDVAVGVLGNGAYQLLMQHLL
ncbi:MAG: hypothetical protein ACRDP6_48175 [Actinoallomurus sp.]